MGARDSRKDDFTPDQRTRLLEQDVDAINERDDRRDSELARIKGIALGLLISVVLLLVGVVLSGGLNK